MMNNKQRGNKRAAVALSVMLITGAIAMETAIAALLVTYLTNQEGLGLKKYNEAVVAAQSGVDDALLRIVRDKNFSSRTYTLSVNDIAVSVLVCRELVADIATLACTTGLSQKYQIISSASSLNKRSRLKATLGFDDYTGEIVIESLESVQAN